MDLNKNPVTQEKIVKDNAERQKKIREKWMMDHGVKYYKHPFEYVNFYGLGRSTGTPGPSLTRNFADHFPRDCNSPFSWVCHPNGSRLNGYLQQNPPYSYNDRSYQGTCGRKCTRPEFAAPVQIHPLPCCKSSPESRFGICSDCFYATFYQY